MPFNEIERRRHPRHAYCEKIEFCLISHSLKMLLGAPIDISDSGMCIYTFDELVVGDSLEMRNALPVPYLKATVRWVKDYSGNYYKAGIMFD